MKKLFLFLSILLCVCLLAESLADVVNITITDMVATSREGEVFSSRTTDEFWDEEGSSTFSSGMDQSLYKLQYVTVNGNSVTKSSSVTLNHADYPGVSSISVVFMWKQRAVQPPAEDPPAEDPPAEDPPAEDPPAEDPPAEDPPAQDPPAEDPPAEDPPAQDPPAEDPPIENPPAENPPVEDPPSETGENPADAPGNPSDNTPSQNPENPPAENPVDVPTDTGMDVPGEINPPEEQPVPSNPDPAIEQQSDQQPTNPEPSNPDPVMPEPVTVPEPQEEVRPEPQPEPQSEPQPAAEQKEEKPEQKQETRQEEPQEEMIPLVIVPADPVNEKPITYSAPDIVEIYVEPVTTPAPKKSSGKKKKAKATPVPEKRFIITILDENMKPVTASIDTNSIGADGMMVWVEEIGAYLAVEVR